MQQLCTLLVICAYYGVHVAEQLPRRETAYSVPTKNTPAASTLNRSLILSFDTQNIGNTSMEISDAKFQLLIATLYASKPVIHVPGIVGSNSFRTGSHWNSDTKKNVRNQQFCKMMNTTTIQNFGVRFVRRLRFGTNMCKI